MSHTSSTPGSTELPGLRAVARSSAAAGGPTAPSGAAAPKAGRQRREIGGLGLPVAVIALLIAGAISSSDFLTKSNILAVLLTTSITGIVAVCMTPMTLSGNFISLATYQSGMLAALLFVSMAGAGWNIPLACLVTAAALVAVGVIQGLVVAAGLNVVLTTLAVGSMILGLGSIITDGGILSMDDHPVSWGSSQPLGVPLAIYFFAAATAAMTFFVNRTVIGRQIVLTGANRATAATSGISFVRITIWVFVVFSLGLALAGILTGAQLNDVNTDTLNFLTIDAAAAVLVGGTAIQGGLGSPLRSAAGALIIALTTNVMLLNGLSSGAQQAAVGGVVVSVVIALQVIRRRSGTL